MTRPRSDSPPLFDLPIRPDFSLETRLMAQGDTPVAGCDEAGRGPLAGPVVAAAVILDPARIPDGLDDSKRLDTAQREALFDVILADAASVSFASLSAASIDGCDIRKASLEGMVRAVRGLSVSAKHVLADGRDMPPGMPCPATTVIKGDQRSQSIAAASIVAKVIRDRMMTCCAGVDSRYGFDSHMGYATVRHRLAITQHGPSPRLHRLTFAPFRLEAETTVEIALKFG